MNNCGVCERRNECLTDGHIIDVTSWTDSNKRYIRGLGVSCPKEVERAIKTGLINIFETKGDSKMDRCTIQLIEEKWNSEKGVSVLSVAAEFKNVEYNSRNYQSVVEEAFRSGYAVKVKATGEL